jgi:YidC/Oxa1 family membrane protein insertase
VGQIWADFMGLILICLNWFFGWTHDYGVAIILLTVAMRVLLIPLTIKQTQSMMEMQRIQPKLKKLQEKYKKDKEKLQEETMKFYQENKVNPFGGCLPLLLQMPIFIALFRVLGKDGLLFQQISKLPADQSAKAVRFWLLIPDIMKAPSQIFSVQNLLAVVPYLTLVVMFGLSAWLPQKMMTQDPQQQKIGLYMAVFMVYIGWISPAGVLLYWVTSSAWQIAQQWLMTKRFSAEEGA